MGLPDQSLHNWPKAEAAGRLRELTGKAAGAGRMEIARLKAELAKTRMERGILKKRRRIWRGSRGGIRLYRAASKGLPESGAMPGVECRVLNVSAGGYRQYRSRQTGDAGYLPPGPRTGGAALLVPVTAVFNERKGADGWPPIWRELPARGFRAGKEGARKLMKAHGIQARGIQARGKRKFKAAANRSHGLPVPPDLLERGFDAEAPNRVWAGGITHVRTYVWTEEGWLHPAIAAGLFGRRLAGFAAGFAMSGRMTRQLVTGALRMAWFRGRPLSGLIFHSDRGSQYASGGFRKQLPQKQLAASGM